MLPTKAGLPLIDLPTDLAELIDAVVTIDGDPVERPL